MRTKLCMLNNYNYTCMSVLSVSAECSLIIIMWILSDVHALERSRDLYH